MITLLARSTPGRLLTVCWLVIGISACASSYTGAAAGNLGAASGIATSVDGCQSVLRRAKSESSESLDPNDISLLNWNIKKGSKAHWQRDLRAMSADVELITLQEAVLDVGMEADLDRPLYAAFSQGFTTRRRATGVATYSIMEPLSECRLVVTEPLLRTPKATSITEFGLAGVAQTLVVVNVHAVNISLGLIRFRDQFAQIEQVLAAHDGPAIMSGDFNTWRPRRMAIVQRVAEAMGFAPVVLSADERKTFNGLPLDHVFVRGLTVIKGETLSVGSSDHNPILVELHL